MYHEQHRQEQLKLPRETTTGTFEFHGMNKSDSTERKERYGTNKTQKHTTKHTCPSSVSHIFTAASSPPLTILRLWSIS